MGTNLEILRDKYDLATTGGEVVLVFMPKYALEAIKGTYHRLRYELDNITDSNIRDEIESWLDAGQFGIEDEMLVADLLARLDTLNGHMATLTANIVAINETLQADGILFDGASGYGLTAAIVNTPSGSPTAWDDVEIEDLITAIEVIGTLL